MDWCGKSGGLSVTGERYGICRRHRLWEWDQED